MSTSAAPSRLLAGALGALLLVLPGVAMPGAITPTVIAQATPATNADQPQGTTQPTEVTETSPDGPASVLGKKVIGPKRENLGLVVDVLIDSGGQPQAAIIDFGGFLGVGSRKIAIDWKVLDFSQLGHGGTVELGLSRAQIAAAPEYKPGQPGPAVVTAPPAPDATQKNP